ncbi:MAG TPA: FAD-binding oxidoreductase [Methanomassiliicoccales archaeon]|jgi:glycine/D-amino acid oxidase-like deaminating enzyme
MSDRIVDPLKGHERVDVVVIGGGIAGVSTAFDLLEQSNMTVMLIEADRIAHGASGNGSGQVSPSFEGGFPALAERFGPELANAAFRQVAFSKRRFGELIRDAGTPDQVHRVRIHIGFSSIEMAEALAKTSSGNLSDVLPSMKLYAAAGSGWNCELRDRGVTPNRVPPEAIFEMLGTTDESYRAAAIARTRIANVAAISEGLVRSMLIRFPKRFCLHEGSKVLSVHALHPLLIKCEKGQVECKRVVVCTNGYALPDLSNIPNSIPDNYLRCVTGYMNGYRPPREGEGVGLFFHEVQPSTDEPYIFTTTWGKDPETAVLMVGGPQFTCEAGKHRDDMDETAHSRIDHLAEGILGVKTKATTCWDGSMGYTSSGVRLAGPDPKNQDLFYNLGCNGIGILHSIYGARRIAKAMMGERQNDSLFDPKHQFNQR